MLGYNWVMLGYSSGLWVSSQAMLDCTVVMKDYILEMQQVSLRPNLGWLEHKWGCLGYNWG